MERYLLLQNTEAGGGGGMFPACRARNISKAEELNNITAQHITVLGGTCCQADSKLFISDFRLRQVFVLFK